MIKHGSRMFMILKGTRIYWDEDHDEREIPVVSALIDTLEHRFGCNPFVAAGEHEGTLIVVVDDFIHYTQSYPQHFKANKSFTAWLGELVGKISDTILGDCWTAEIYTVMALPTTPYPKPNPHWISGRRTAD